MPCQSFLNIQLVFNIRMLHLILFELTAFNEKKEMSK